MAAGHEVHEGQAEAHALADAAGREEGIEDLSAQSGRHSGPVVGEADLDLALAADTPDAQHAARAGLRGVAQQVRHRGGQRPGVGVDGRQARHAVEAHVQGQAVVEGRLHDLLEEGPGGTSRKEVDSSRTMSRARRACCSIWSPLSGMTTEAARARRHTSSS